MQDQAVLCRILCFQRFLQRTDSQAAGDVPVCDAGDHTPVMQVDYAAVVAHFPVLQGQISEIRTPFLIRPVRLEILFHQISKYLVGLPWVRFPFFRADDGTQPQLLIHIGMDRGSAVMIPSALQIYRHSAVTVNPIMAVVNFLYLSLHLCFLGIITRFPVFPVVVIRIRADAKPTKQPADAEFLIMLFQKPISL